MAFVNEKILEIDRELFNSFNLKSPFTRKPLEPFMWTADKEREIYLIGLGGQGFDEGDVPEYFALIWKRKKITIETFNGGSGSRSTGIEKWWRIIGIKVFESLIPEKDIMIDIIKEAFNAYGSRYSSNYV